MRKPKCNLNAFQGLGAMMTKFSGQEIIRQLSPVYLQNLTIFLKITSSMFDVFSKLDLDLKLEPFVATKGQKCSNCS